jgi:hypothetical protein
LLIPTQDATTKLIGFKQLKKMSRKTVFNVLPLEDQAAMAWNGEFISSIKLQKGCVMLYLVENDFFVEVFYHQEKKEIIGITLAKEERLPAYAEKVNIDSLLN